MTRSVALVFVCIALLIGGCGSASPPAHVRTGDEAGSGPPDDAWHTARLGAGSWEGARTAPDGRSLVIVLVGGPEYVDGQPCSVAYKAETRETDAEVRVTILDARPPATGDVSCTAEGHFREIEADLHQPLGSRRVIDEQFDRDQPVFDGASLAEATWLPDGWSRRAEGPGYSAPQPTTSWMQTWGAASGRPAGGPCGTSGYASVSLTQGPPGLVDAYPTNGEQPTSRYDVHGQQATYFEGGVGLTRLSWVEHDRGLVLVSFPECAGASGVAADTLVAIARSLTVPA